MRSIRTEFDHFAVSYEKDINRALLPGLGNGAKFARIKAAHLCRQVAAVFGPAKKPSLLDAGCGIGIVDELLKPLFPRLAGFDVSPESVALARQRNPELRYEISDGSTFPFREKEFDAVFAICVLHHMSPCQRPGFVAEAYRVLRPGGALFLYEHNPWNPLTRWVVRRCPFDKDASLLNQSACRHLLQAGGFRPVDGGGLIFFPSEAAAWQSWEARWLRRIPLGAQFYVTGLKMSGHA